LNMMKWRKLRPALYYSLPECKYMSYLIGALFVILLLMRTNRIDSNLFIAL
jgi:hypothetical protein